MTQHDSTNTLPQPVIAGYAILVSFCTYFCMYAFRKPFSAAKYEDLTFLDTDFDMKTVFVISQIVGYALSKVIGIRVCSEISPGRRAAGLVGLVVFAEFALLLFAVLPGEWKVVAIFLNGLPLGMVWGLVVWYLEGRQTSELLLAGLSCSFILASGIVKDIGRWLMTDCNVDQFWMPFVAGLLFLPPYLISVYLLNLLPNPTPEDIRLRVLRTTMDGRDRWAFITRFLPGLLMLMFVYFFLTAYRDIRDNFGVEIFKELNYGDEEPVLFTRSELWVAFGVMATLAALNLIRNNRRGLIGAFVVMGTGTALLGVSTVLQQNGQIDGLTWMILTGLGSYLAYVPFGSVLFDRLIASTQAVGTAVFAIYVADAIGYMGAITVLLGMDSGGSGELSHLEFFRKFTYFMSIMGTVLLACSCLYFLIVHVRKRNEFTLS